MNIKQLGTFILTAIVIGLGGCARPDPAEQLKPVLEKYLNVWNTGEFAGLDQIVSDKFELRMSPAFEPVRGLDSLRVSISYWRLAYPDFHITIDEAIYTPNAVAVRWTITASNTGPGRMPPTGKKVVVPGMSIIHVSEGKVADEWISANDLSWATQLGYSLAPQKTEKAIKPQKPSKPEKKAKAVKPSKPVKKKKK